MSEVNDLQAKVAASANKITDLAAELKEVSAPKKIVQNIKKDSAQIAKEFALNEDGKPSAALIVLATAAAFLILLKVGKLFRHSK